MAKQFKTSIAKKVKRLNKTSRKQAIDFSELTESNNNIFLKKGK